jgi:hypothetical protein
MCLTECRSLKTNQFVEFNKKANMDDDIRNHGRCVLREYLSPASYPIKEEMIRAEKVEIMRQRYLRGEDLWTGEPLDNARQVPDIDNSGFSERI